MFNGRPGRLGNATQDIFQSRKVPARVLIHMLRVGKSGVPIKGILSGWLLARGSADFQSLTVKFWLSRFRQIRSGWKRRRVFDKHICYGRVLACGLIGALLGNFGQPRIFCLNLGGIARLSSLRLYRLLELAREDAAYFLGLRARGGSRRRRLCRVAYRTGLDQMCFHYVFGPWGPTRKMHVGHQFFL